MQYPWVHSNRSSTRHRPQLREAPLCSPFASLRFPCPCFRSRLFYSVVGAELSASTRLRIPLRVLSISSIVLLRAATSCVRSAGTDGVAAGVSQAFIPAARNWLRLPRPPRPLPKPAPRQALKLPDTAYPAQRPRPRPVIGPCPRGPVLSPNGICIPPLSLSEMLKLRMVDVRNCYSWL